jgi:cytochrome c-type biogenesis protein CcmH/NrfG
MEANYNLFDVLERQNRQEEAFPYLVRAYKLNPDDPDIGLAYAYRLNEIENSAKAKEILEHLISIDPQNRAASRLLESINRGSRK